jgi:hypothetical protein
LKRGGGTTLYLKGGFMEDNRILRLVYTFFLGLLLAIFVGVGINTFYPGPKAPEYPTSTEFSYNKEPTQEQKDAEKQYEIQNKAYMEKMKPYSRNVSMITLVAAVAFLAISIVFEKRIKVIADGVMLGGLFTLLYSIIRGFMSEDNKYVFLVVTVGLVVVLYLGYHRFVRIPAVKTKPAGKKV